MALVAVLGAAGPAAGRALPGPLLCWAPGCSSGCSPHAEGLPSSLLYSQVLPVITPLIPHFVTAPGRPQQPPGVWAAFPVRVVSRRRLASRRTHGWGLPGTRPGRPRDRGAGGSRRPARAAATLADRGCLEPCSQGALWAEPRDEGRSSRWRRREAGWARGRLEEKKRERRRRRRRRVREREREGGAGGQTDRLPHAKPGGCGREGTAEAQVPREPGAAHGSEVR